MSATRDWICADELPLDGLEIFADRLEDLRQVGRRRGILRLSAQRGASVCNDRFTILDFRAECQRAKPLDLSSFRLQGRPKSVVEIPGHLRRPASAAGAPRIVGNLLDHLGDVRRLVALAAVRHRRQVGSVGFDQQPVRGDDLAAARMPSARGNVTMPANDR